jgi:hypothetical protein
MPAGEAELVALALAGTAQVSAAHGHAEDTLAEGHCASYQVGRRRRQAAARALVRRARVHGCGGGSSKECRMIRIFPVMVASALNFMHALACPVD